MDCCQTDGNTPFWESQRSSTDSYPRLPPTWRVKSGSEVSLINDLNNLNDTDMPTEYLVWCWSLLQKALRKINRPKEPAGGGWLGFFLWKNRVPTILSLATSQACAKVFKGTVQWASGPTMTRSKLTKTCRVTSHGKGPIKSSLLGCISKLFYKIVRIMWVNTLLPKEIVLIQ